MKLIGMMDSPYVRRAAIGLKMLGIPFEHQSISVFGGFEAFQAINPVVKAPTLVLDDGQVLIDSTLILQYATAIAPAGKTLMPSDSTALLRTLRLIGLALAASEKTVQIVYERRLRPSEKQHAPWLERVSGQLLAAYDALEKECASMPFAKSADAFTDADLSIAVSWTFSQMMVPETVDAARYPGLQAFSVFAEQLPFFIDTPPV